MYILHTLTVSLGLTSVVLSAVLSYYFSRSEQRIAKAVSYMLAGEAFVGLVTVMFSCFAHGFFDVIGPGVAMCMRWAMFIVASGTSLHLAFQLRLIELSMVNGEKEDGD